ncbi:hypothetical protein [Frankia sp. AgB32]|uniref:hypothetical protein n=1 Tax=Frankia sp. AgB32 TaxID=631119 RepID=UPI0020105AD6|nr:hypothetical protein [Frankia sp. AgB32]MCK9898238.1 hypothetical protein [Frankia sp. AgB32]
MPLPTARPRTAQSAVQPVPSGISTEAIPSSANTWSNAMTNSSSYLGFGLV